jgi:hypothetical protein
MDAVWVKPPSRPPTEEETTQLAALRRLAGILGVHFLEEEGDDLVAPVRRVAAESRLDVHLRRDARRVAAPRDLRRLAPLTHGARIARPRHPRGRQPGRQGSAEGVIAAVIALAGLAAVLAATLVARSGFHLRRQRPGSRRILVPFTGGTLDSTVLDAAIRLARAEDATLVPAYLLLVPLRHAEDSPLRNEVAVAKSASTGSWHRRRTDAEVGSQRGM